MEFYPIDYKSMPGAVVQWDGPLGTSYQCGPCYARALNATAPQIAMSSPPRTPAPAGTRCQCGQVLA